MLHGRELEVQFAEGDRKSKAKEYNMQIENTVPYLFTVYHTHFLMLKIMMTQHKPFSSSQHQHRCVARKREKRMVTAVVAGEITTMKATGTF